MDMKKIIALLALILCFMQSSLAIITHAGDITTYNQNTYINVSGFNQTDNSLNTTGLTIGANTNYLQRRVNESCLAGSSIRVINQDGTVTCETDDTGAGMYDLNITSDSGSGVIENGEILTITGSGSVTTAISGNTLTISGTGGGSGNTTEEIQTAVNVSAYYIFTAASALECDGTNFGTLTNNKVCTYDLTSTEIDCNTDMTVDTDDQTCAEVSGCVENAITDGNTNWDNTYGFVTNSTMNQSVDCANIDGATSDLCTLVDTDTDTWNTTQQMQTATYTLYVEPNNANDIQTKIDSCNTDYCKIMIPPGSYHISNSITIRNKDGVTLEGMGDYATQIYCPNNITCIEIGSNFSYYSTKNQVKNLKIVREATCTTGTGIGIALNYTKNALIEKVEINGICGTGFLLTNYARYNVITNSMTNNIIGQALHITTPNDGSKKSMNNIITNNNLLSIQETAVQIDNYADWNKISNNFIQTTNATVVKIGETGGGTTYATQFTNNFIDYLGTTATYNAIETVDCNTCQITENLIQTQETAITLNNGITKSGNTNTRVFNNHCESDITTCGNDDLYYDAVADFLISATDEYICSYESTGTGIACDSSTSGTGAIIRQNGPGIYNPYLGLETNARTTSGFLFYDATNDRIGVGDGSASDYFVPIGTVAAGGVCAYDSTNKIINCTSSAGANTDVTDWTAHNSYPAGCEAGKYVTAIGDTLTCDTPAGSSTFDLNITSDSGSGTITNSEIFTFTGAGTTTTSIAGNTLTITSTDTDDQTCAEVSGCVENAITDGNTNWDNTYGFVTNSTMNQSVHCSNINGETSNLCTLVDTDTNTNAATICTGTTTYLDGEGNCDDISSVYLDSVSDVIGTQTDEYVCTWEATTGKVDCDTQYPIASDLSCTDCITGTEIATLTDADISDTLTCSVLTAASSVVADSEVDDDITISSGTNKDISALDGLVKACDGGTCTTPTNNADGWLYSESGIETDGDLDIDGTGTSNFAGDIKLLDNKKLYLGTDAGDGCIYWDGSKIVIDGSC